MPISFLTTALLIVSVITNLTVEGIKKLLDGTKVKYFQCSCGYFIRPDRLCCQCNLPYHD